jgi:hypothetical protein
MIEVHRRRMYAEKAPKPRVPRVSIFAADPHFNSTVTVDIVSINGKSAVHFVRKDTGFQGGGCLKYQYDNGSKKESSRAVWNVFMNRWRLVYFGPPGFFRHD